MELRKKIKSFLRENFQKNILPEGIIEIGLNNDSYEFEDLDLDEYKLSDEAYSIANDNGINILRGMDLALVLYDEDTSNVVGGLWINDGSSGQFSFDIAIKKDYQGKGLSHKLIRAALDEYRNLNYDFNLPIEIKVVSKILEDTLKKHYGFFVKRRYGDTAIMGLKRKK